MSNNITQYDQTRTSSDKMLLNAESPRERQILLVEREFEMQQRTAMVYAKSTVVPEQYRNNPANCIIAQEMAHRLDTGVLEIMQNLYVVHGRPAFSSAYMIARINASGLIKGTLKFNFVGTEGQDDWGCYCTAIDAESGEEMRGPTITIAMAKAEGWATKNGSKWKTMPEVMLRYRAAAFFARGNIPQAIMGMQAREEVEDTEERDITPRSNVSDINDAFRPKPLGQPVNKETGEITDDGPQDDRQSSDMAAPSESAEQAAAEPVGANSEEPSAEGIFGQGQ